MLFVEIQTETESTSQSIENTRGIGTSQPDTLTSTKEAATSSELEITPTEGEDETVLSSVYVLTEANSSEDELESNSTLESTSQSTIMATSENTEESTNKASTMFLDYSTAIESASLNLIQPSPASFSYTGIVPETTEAQTPIQHQIINHETDSTTIITGASTT